MNENKNLTREEIPFRAYTFCGVECIDTRSPRHHGWGGKSQKKIRRERRQRGGKR